MFIDTIYICCYYTLVRLCTGGAGVSLSELSSSERVAGISAVMRSLKACRAEKVFLSKEADIKLLSEIIKAADETNVPIEWAEESQQLGRACAIQRKTAAAALLKKKKY